MTDPARRREQLTVIVPCFNNEAYIERCLESVRWADEVLLVDSFSSDRTVEMARPHVTRVIQREYENSASQKNWAIPQATNEWVLVVDTDEIVTDQLRLEILDALAHPDGYQGFRIARKNIVFDRWLEHGGYWPDYQIRLFRRDTSRYRPRHVHADVIVDGPVGTLTAPFLHYPHRSFGSIRRTLLDRYVTWETEQKQQEGVAFRWSQLGIRPLGAFVTRGIVKGGLRDGWQGLLMSLVWTTYVWKTYWRLRARQRRE